MDITEDGAVETAECLVSGGWRELHCCSDEDHDVVENMNLQ